MAQLNTWLYQFLWSQRKASAVAGGKQTISCVVVFNQQLDIIRMSEYSDNAAKYFSSVKYFLLHDNIIIVLELGYMVRVEMAGDDLLSASHSPSHFSQHQILSWKINFTVITSFLHYITSCL